MKTKEILPGHLSKQATMCKEKLVNLIAGDKVVQLHWKTVGADIVDEEDGFDLLSRMVDMWLKIRGFPSVRRLQTS